MRFVAFALLVLPVAACAGGPQALGITGPRGAAPAADVAPAPPTGGPLDDPATTQSGERYGPSYAPTTGGGHFWGYN